MTAAGGGMGEMHPVSDTRLERTIAIKLLSYSSAGDAQPKGHRSHLGTSAVEFATDDWT